MVERRQLPPQIKRVELAQRDGGRPVIRYQLTVDVGVVDGKRKQLRRRYASEKEARAALDAVRGDAAKGTYVHPSKVTLAEVCEDWLAAKHRLKPSTLHGHRVNLAAALAELGDVEVQNLSKRHVDDLVTALRAGGLPSPTGKSRKAWSPRSVNYMLGLLTPVLRDQMRQGHVVRNVAELVDRIPDPKPADTFTPAELHRVLDHIDGNRYAIAWQLTLTGLRRGEVAGLRWSDIDLDARRLQISSTRLRFGKHLIRTPRSHGQDAGGCPSPTTSPPHADRPGHPGGRSAGARRVLRSERRRGGRRSRRGAQSARTDVSVGAHAEGRRCPSHSVPRRTAYVRDADAFAGRADRGDLCVARPLVEGVHDGHLRAFAARSVEHSGAEFRTSCDDKP